MKTYQIENARYYVNGILNGYEYQSSTTLTYHIPNYQAVQLVFAAKEKKTKSKHCSLLRCSSQMLE